MSSYSIMSPRKSRKPIKKIQIKKSKSNRKTKKGGCGCGKVSGGGALGPDSLANFDSKHVFSYALNDYINDPLHEMVDVRMQPNMTGGKKRRIRKGGNNVLSDSGTVTGAAKDSNIVMGVSQEASSDSIPPTFI